MINENKIENEEQTRVPNESVQNEVFYTLTQTYANSFDSGKALGGGGDIQ